MQIPDAPEYIKDIFRAVLALGEAELAKAPFDPIAGNVFKRSGDGIMLDPYSEQVSAQLFSSPDMGKLVNLAAMSPYEPGDDSLWGVFTLSLGYSTGLKLMTPAQAEQAKADLDARTNVCRCLVITLRLGVEGWCATALAPGGKLNGQRGPIVQIGGPYVGLPELPGAIIRGPH